MSKNTKLNGRTRTNSRKSGVFSVLNCIAKLFALAAVISIGVLVLAGTTNAINLPPVVSIGASPNPTALTSTVTAVAVDLSGSGIANVKIYENANLVRQCSSSTCVYIATHTTPGVRSYYATTSDNLGGGATSNTINVNFTNTPPVLASIGNKTVEVLSLVQFTISASDYNGDPLTYSVSGLPSGANFDSNTRTFSWTPSIVQLGLSFVNFSVSDGYASDSEIVAINVTDTQAPTYFNLGTNPSSPATYAPLQNYTFSANWIDNVAVSSVWIEFNGANYSVSGTSGVYTFTASDLAAGNYSYRWFANDSSGNSNSSASFVYTVDKAPTSTSVVTNPNSPITYGTASNFSCSNTGNIIPTLYINGADASSEFGVDVVRAAGNYSLNCTALENQNYTGSAALANYTVNKAIPLLDSYMPISITYGEAANYSANESNSGDGDLVYVLTRNGVNIANGSSVSDSAVLGAGNWTYNYSTAGGENYTSAELVNTLVVNKADPLNSSTPLNITLLPSSSVTWGTQSNVSGINCPSQITCTLYRNDAAVPNPDVANLSAGVYNYTYNTTGNENYTSASVSDILTVTKIAPNLNLYLNGNASDLSITYNASVNVSASSSTSSIELYRNGANVTSELGQSVILGAGTYNYTAVALENENYSSANVSWTLTVNKAVSQCFISGNSSTYPNPVNVSASCTNPEVALQMSRNGSDVTSENGNNVIVGAGNWTYNVSVPESENYTSASNSTSVFVAKGSAQTSLVFDKSSPQNYSTSITAACSVISGELTPVLYRNGSDVTTENGNSVLLGAGNWTYNCTLAESANYTAAENVSSFVIDPIVMPIHLYVDGAEANKSVVYGASTNVSGTKDFAEGNLTLLRDGSSVSNPEIAALGAGIYNYTLDFAATQNYTANSQSFFVNVTQATPVLNLSILPSNSVANGTTINVTGFGCPAEITCNLYRNGTIVSNPDVATLGFGNYSYDYNTTGNANYSSAGVSGNLSVFDGTNPTIWFNSGTTASGNQTVNSIAVNVSASDDVGLSNITVSLFNGTGFLASSSSSVSNPLFVNFTGLSDGVYYFNATAYDSSNNFNSTETRTVVIDASIPSVTGLSVNPSTVFLTQGVVISANVSDSSLASVTANVTLPDSTVQTITLSGSGNVFSGAYSNTLQNGTYGVRIVAVDGAGNTNSSESTTFAVSYAVRTISNSSIYGVYYSSNFTYDVTTTNVSNATINDSTISGSPVNISNSIIVNSTLSNVSLIDYCQVYDSVVIGGTCNNSYIDPSNVQNSTTTGSTIIDSRVWNSNATYSYIENSSLDYASVNGSSINNSNLSNLTATSAVIDNATLGDSLNITFSDGTISGTTVYNGSFTYNGTTVNLTSIGSRGFVYLVNYEPTAVLNVSNLNVYVGDSITFDASGSSDPNMVNGSNIALTFTDSLNYTFYFDPMTGDSLTTNASVVSYSYQNPGTYTVYARVTDALGEFSTSVSYQISVSARPKSGGGGGGGSCETEWICSEWSACEDGVKTRTCTKAVGRCYANESKPSESEVCVSEPEEEEKGIIGEIGSRVAGAVSGAVGKPGVKTALIFAFAVVAAGGVVWLLRRRFALKPKGRKNQNRS